MLRMCEMIAKILLLQIKIALSLPQNTPLCPPPRWNFSRDFYCLCGGGWRQIPPPPLRVCRWENLPRLILSSNVYK